MNDPDEFKNILEQLKDINKVVSIKDKTLKSVEKFEPNNAIKVLYKSIEK